MRLNPDLDLAAARAAFERDGFCKLYPFVVAPEAATLAESLETATPWSLKLVDAAGKPSWLSRQTLATLPERQIQERLQGAAQAAAKAFSFLHLAWTPDIEPGAEAVEDLLSWLASDSFLKVAEQATGATGKLLEAEARAYRPGDFTTLHADSRAKIGFELFFTPVWRPDWGGQLAVFDKNGDVAFGASPTLNAAIFYRSDAPRSVLSVAPFAGAPRFSIAGRIG